MEAVVWKDASRRDNAAYQLAAEADSGELYSARSRQPEGNARQARRLELEDVSVRETDRRERTRWVLQHDIAGVTVDR